MKHHMIEVSHLKICWACPHGYYLVECSVKYFCFPCCQHACVNLGLGPTIDLVVSQTRWLARSVIDIQEEVKSWAGSMQLIWYNLLLTFTWNRVSAIDRGELDRSIYQDLQWRSAEEVSTSGSMWDAKAQDLSVLERAALTITDKLATERRSLKEVEQQLKSIDKVLIHLPKYLYWPCLVKLNGFFHFAI